MTQQTSSEPASGGFFDFLKSETREIGRVQALKVVDLQPLLLQAFAIGRRHYLLFFAVCLLREVTVHLLSDSGFFASFMSSIFTALLGVGALAVAQAIVGGKKEIAISDFFIAFIDGRVFKRLTPYFVYCILYLIVFGMLMIIPIILGAVLGAKGFEQGSGLPLSLYGVMFLVGALGGFLALPFTMFLPLLQFRSDRWRPLAALSVLGFVKSFRAFLIFLIPIVFLTLVGLLASGLPAHTSMVKGAMRAVSIVLWPFFLAFPYLMYKRIYEFADEDIELLDLPPRESFVANANANDGSSEG
ncbi:MAG: hypothetical protein RBT63_04555 [Bdellovibrionales bacterium]|jgi:hypothetical protein|nr:hypothetical protein [Bdellovibrionales bacterium]